MSRWTIKTQNWNLWAGLRVWNAHNRYYSSISTIKMATCTTFFKHFTKQPRMNMPATFTTIISKIYKLSMSWNSYWLLNFTCLMIIRMEYSYPNTELGSKPLWPLFQSRNSCCYHNFPWNSCRSQQCQDTTSRTRFGHCQSFKIPKQCCCPLPKCARHNPWGKMRWNNLHI